MVTFDVCIIVGYTEVVGFIVPTTDEAWYVMTAKVVDVFFELLLS
jgi:hypothetical protein